MIKDTKMDIDFELYKIFFHAASEKSFTAAAKRLFITQSAVSQAIRNLEDKTGTVLFYRKSRSISLTPEGATLFTIVEQAYNLLKSGENRLQEAKGLQSGEIRIGAGDTVCKHFLMPCIGQFTKKYPGIKVRMINRTSSQITGLLKNNQLDLGIVTYPASDRSPGRISHKEADVIPFRQANDIFAAPMKFKELKNRLIGLDELVKYPLLLLERGSVTRRNLDAFFKRAGLEPDPELELESIDLLVEFAKIGMGIAHVLAESAAPAIEQGLLFEVGMETPLPERSLGIVLPADVPRSKAASAFLDILTAV